MYEIGAKLSSLFCCRDINGVCLITGEAKSGHNIGDEFYKALSGALRILNFQEKAAILVTSAAEVHIYTLQRSVRDITSQKYIYVLNRNNPVQYADTMLEIINHLVEVLDKIHKSIKREQYPTELTDFYLASRNDPTKPNLTGKPKPVIDCLYLGRDEEFARSFYPGAFFEEVYQPGLEGMLAAEPILPTQAAIDADAVTKSDRKARGRHNTGQWDKKGITGKTKQKKEQEKKGS